MNQVFAGATALIIALMLWGLGKKPNRGLITKTDPNAFGGNNLQQHALVERTKASITKQNHLPALTELAWQAPNSVQERIKLEKQLQKLIAGGPEERLKAVALGHLWGHANALPILRRGLKDSDSRVIAAAANALQKHRGVPSLKNSQEQETSRPPRNVALMR